MFCSTGRTFLAHPCPDLAELEAQQQSLCMTYNCYQTMSQLHRTGTFFQALDSPSSFEKHFLDIKKMFFRCQERLNPARRKSPIRPRKCHAVSCGLTRAGAPGTGEKIDLARKKRLARLPLRRKKAGAGTPAFQPHIVLRVRCRDPLRWKKDRHLHTCDRKPKGSSDTL